MRYRRLGMPWIVLVGSLSGCGGGGGIGGMAPPACTVPCLNAAPSLSVATLPSSTGGMVQVEFEIRGEIANVSNITIMLNSTDITGAEPVGSAVVTSPTQAGNVVDVTVNAGVTPGTYYPHIAFTTVTPSNSGNQYYLDPTKSTTNYTYVEVVGGSGTTPTLTSFAIPKLTIN